MLNGLISARPVVLGVVALSLLVVAPWASAGGLSAGARHALAAPPLNDSFVAAQLLGGEVGEVVATSKDGTKEAGEPAHAGEAGGASVWFQWTAAREGSLTVWVNVPTFDTVMGVYTGGAVGALTEVASNDDYGASTASRVTFPVDVGTTYRIAVDGVGGTEGPFRLRWRQGPVNDFFADAEVLTGPSGSVEGSSFGATAEPGEASELSAVSTWFRWTAPEDGSFGFHVRSAEGLTVYTGSSPGTLVALGPTGTELVFTAVAGTEYSVRVAGFTWNDGFPFTLFWGESPTNDAFANAIEIDGSTGKTAGSTAFAGEETGEPPRGTATVWYTWTAPTTGHFRSDAWMVDDTAWGWINTTLAVYRGATVDALTLVARNTGWWQSPLPEAGSAVSFRAVAGTAYSIAVDSGGSFSWGPFELRWYPGAIIFGKAGSDQIKGTAGRDYIDGRGGNDVLRGLGGSDYVVGGSGRDRLFGEGGADLLDSRDFVRGNDEIDGGSGTDRAIRDRQDTVRNVP